jgi:Gas vesicle protein
VNRARQSVGPVRASHDVALIDLLDRLLQGGIVIQGDVILAAADVDLVKLDLRILVAAIDKAMGE